MSTRRQPVTAGARDLARSAGPAVAPAGTGVAGAPMSFAQERLWLIDMAAPGAATYNVPLLTRWHEPVDPAALGAALTAVVARHETLRTTYHLRDDQPVQVVEPPRSVQVEELPFDPARADGQLAARARRPFDLAAGPVLRCTVWRGAPGGDLMLLAIHHIAVDGWSLGPLYHDLDEAYGAALAGAEPALPPLPVQYSDFAVRDRAAFAGREGQRRLADRAAELLAGGEPLVLAGARPGPVPAAGRPGDQRTFRLPAPLWPDLLELARAMRVTPFVLLHAALQEVLRRWSDRTDFIVGAVTANRPYPDIEPLVGFFVNTVPMRCQVRPDWTFRELCHRARDEAYRTLTHQWIPFDRLTARIAPARAAGHTPLVNVCLALQNMPRARDGLARWSSPAVLPTGTAKFDLLITIEEDQGQALGTVEYATDRYPAEVCDGVIADFLELLGRVRGDADVPLRLLPLTEVPAHLIRPPAHPATREAPAGPPAGLPGGEPAEHEAGAAPPDPAPASHQALAAELFRAALATLGGNAAGAHRRELEATSDFFAMGGNSLLAVTMVARAGRRHGVLLSPRDFLADPTVAGLARMLARGTGTAGTGSPTAAAADRHPASPAQQRFWFLDRIPELRAAYLMPSVIELRGAVEIGALVAAVDLVLARHPALRSVFELDRKERRVYYRTDAVPPPARVTDATGWAPAALRDHLATLCWSGFDLAADAPVRADIIRTGPDRTLLVLVMAHIVADGWSRGLLVEQIASAYRSHLLGVPPVLAAPVHPGTLRRDPAPGEADDLVAWLRGAPTDIDLPYDRPRREIQSTAAAGVSVALEPELAARAGVVAAESACTTFMVTAALVGATLARCGSQRDFIFAFPWADRDEPAGMAAVAMLVNTLALRVDLRGAGSWRELLARVRNSSMVAYRNAGASFDAVAAALHPDRDLSRPPLTPVYLSAEQGPAAAPRFAGDVHAGYLPLDPLHIKYELEFTATGHGDRLEFGLSYAVDLFDRRTAEDLIARLAEAAADLAMSPDKPPAGEC
jgi:non-ribosomal peptide synthetase component F